MNFIDLFAGAGGFSLGLYQAGMRGLFAVERDPMAFSTLEHNLVNGNGAFEWPEWLPKQPMDIRYLLKSYSVQLSKLSGKVDAVVGGPPCQGFSTAGRRIEHDERNQLFKEYVKFVEVVRPKVIVFENVPGFSYSFKKMQSTNVPYSSRLTAELRAIGYEDPVQGIYDFSDYGVPQSRRRLLLGSMLKGEDPHKLSEKLLSGRVSRKVTVKDAISDLKRIHGEGKSPDSGSFMTGIYGLAESEYQKRMRLRTNEMMPDSHRFARHSRRVTERLSKIVSLSSQDRNLAKYYIKSLGLKKRDIRPLNPELPSPTLTSLPDDYVHYSEPRILTVREYARIQSFPDWYEFRGNYTTGGTRRRMETPRYTQVANAVPPLYAFLVGKIIKNALS
jgi:DNA (cytosine-5)-methyltransferase 1